MIISVIQVIIILFALFAWSRAFLRMKSKDIGPMEFAFWSFIWASIIVVSLFPIVISRISEWVGIGRAVDLAVYVSIILLFYLMFRIYVRIEKQNQEMTKLVREIAIERGRKRK